MLKTKWRKALLISGLILTIFLIYLPVVLTHFYHDITGQAKAINGGMDLSAAELADKNVYLDGQWEFYWRHFIVSDAETSSKSDLLMKVPDEWSLYKIDDVSLPAAGFGSYKLELTDLDYHNPVTIYLPNFGGAYRVFIDGVLTAESGILSKDTNKIFTVPKAELHPVTLSKAKIHEVVIEIATTRFSGLYMTPVMGDYYRIMEKNYFTNSVRFIIFGIALYSFFSLLAIYILTVRQKLHSFWMPIMIFFIILRIMLTSEFYSFWQRTLFFGLSYESTNELMYLTTFVLKFLLFYLVQEQCGITFSKREKTRFFIYYSVLYFIYLLVPQDIYNYYLSVLIPTLTFVLDIYLFIKIYIRRENIIKFGMAAFGGVILLTIGLAIDSFYINGKIYMNMSLTMILLLMAFLLLMNWVYTMRIGDLYDDFAISSSHLELAKNQIAMQKEYYQSLYGQMNEIREIKHDIRHFIGVMNQLTEAGKFDNLKIFLREYNEKVKMEQLPVFCEHTIANSIIGYYYLRAKEYAISFESQCNIYEQNPMSDSDLCIVLGNALENAIYACKQLDDPLRVRYVTVESRSMKGQWLIKIMNSYNGVLEINDGRYISSKSKGSHGLGIGNIRKVIGTYGGFVEIEHNEEQFTLMAAIPENKSIIL